MKMAITWTIVVLGALLHGMKCDPLPSNKPSSAGSAIPDSPTSLTSTGSPVLTSLSSTGSPVLTSPTSLSSTGSPVPTLFTSLSSTGPPDSTPPTSLGSTGPPDSTPPTSLGSTGSPVLNAPNSTDSTPPAPMGSTRPTSLDPTNPLTNENSHPQPNANDSLTEHNTTTIQPNTSPTVSNHSPQNSPTTVISSVNRNTPNSSILVTTTHNENGKTPLNQRDPSAVTTNPAPYSKSTGSQSIKTLEAQTTFAPNTSVPRPGPRGLDNDPETSSSTPRQIPYPVFDLSSSSEGSIVFETCKTLGQKLKGNCSVSLKFQGNQLVATVIINANQKIPTENYKPLEQKAEVSEETIPDTLVAILASCGALVLILCCFAAYCTYHRRSYRKNQQHLTEEMQTVENGYHDNPTLEVMEVVPEMQEKKLALNGEFNDSWIVPIDNLLKDDIPDEEDTHL